MKWISPALVTALLVQVVYLPCSAQDAAMPVGDEIDRTRLKVGVHVWVTYLKGGKKTTAEGKIKAVGKNALTVGRGLWKEDIKYQNIISLKTGPPPGDKIRLTSRQSIPLGARIRVSILMPDG